ncbi:MAG: hypothetical protein QOI19_1651 [Thermoleophilaceae bacterium]|jgi:anti-anti-sigma regulatory factor|nr:hypothetical protein [Thermoleophilaceae bacterium]
MTIVITSKRTDGVGVLTLDGECDAQTSNDLSGRLAAVASETIRIVVDVQGVADLDLATGLLLVVTAGAIRERGGRLAAVVNRRTPTAQLISELTTRADLDVFDRVEDGISRLAGPLEARGDSTKPADVVHLRRGGGAASDTLGAPVVSAALDALSYREGKILEWRFGLYGSAPVGYREIAERLSMQVAAVRNVEREALSRVERGPA